MTKIISIDQRGTLTLPKEIRELLGLSGSGQVVVESTKKGVLLRPEVIVPVEIYDKEKLEDLKKADAGLSPYAGKIKTALKGKKKRK